MALPHHMRADDPAAADSARRRLFQRSSFPRLPALPSRPSKLSLHSLPATAPDPDDDILIDDPDRPTPDPDPNLFRWAVVYENQRGITLFSTPLYSPLSLLPSDPLPFTIPNAPSSCLNLSLDNYPLPDGTWRWVSTAWMIDMRTERGEVQHDGFEYNWSFRDNNWHATVGRLGAGAWVRRRRWVRLMMRPSFHARNLAPSRSPSSPSLAHTPLDTSSLELDRTTSYVWNGSEHDWQHVHRMLRSLGRDGRKLEVWRTWLGPYAFTRMSDLKGKGKPSLPLQHTLEKRLSDVLPEDNPPPLVHLIPILRNHGEAILRSFVFPDSRAQFVGLVRLAGLAEHLESCLGRAFSAADVDFWSYTDDLNKRLH